MISDEELKSKLTEEEIEAAYRYQLRYYDMLDVKLMLEQYKQIDNFFVKELTEEQIKDVAEVYRGSFDCTISQWDQIFDVLYGWDYICNA